jgi:hypothetical protein
MNDATSRGIVPLADVRRAVGYVTDYLWEQQESNPGTRYDGERRLCCFDQLQVIADWLTEQEQPERNSNTLQNED